MVDHNREAHAAELAEYKGRRSEPSSRAAEKALYWRLQVVNRKRKRARWKRNQRRIVGSKEWRRVQAKRDRMRAERSIPLHWMAL